VRRQDGYKLGLKNVFTDMLELTDILLKESTHQLAPPELSILPPEDSKTFTFHTIDRRGVSNAQETLPWEEMQEFIITMFALFGKGVAEKDTMWYQRDE
jgi:hypothetical protein